MGWWWSKSEGKPDSSTSHGVHDAPDSVSYKEDVLQSKDLSPRSSQLSREEQGDRELLAFLKEIQAEEKTNSRLSSHDSTYPIALKPPQDISPDSLYPTELHCRSALDYAMFCQSFGGQFVNVYRYGTFRSCSNHWQDFWLCMRTRKWEEKDRVQAVQDHYRKKAIKYKTGPSSEDVWEVRTEPLRGPFQGDLEALEQQIHDWETRNPGTPNPWVRRADDVGRE